MTKLPFAFALLVGLSINASSQASPGKTEDTPILEANQCSGENFPTDKGNSPSCCKQEDGNIFHLIEVSPFLKRVAHRKLGAVCSDEGGLQTCTGTACYFGPCGVARVETWDGNTAEIFIPNDSAQKRSCGYQLNFHRQLVVQFPEPFDKQTQYPAVTASCLYGTCLSGGKRANTFTINVEVSNGTGRTSIDPGDITLLGAANAAVVLAEGGITLTAEPIGSHTRVEFSGACSIKGASAETIKCDIPMAPDPKVTVTYVCSSGLACQLNQPTPPILH
jgi:hypothetical protein